ncbi:histidine kinase [Campylobacter sp. JMF_04 NA10]|uniref:histidine kinase n=1 Tax=Campylobacter sp. JMF_04 NA10 TaxID=2983824 RepID=UPI0022E9BADB|nr:histidine kinase [Campylobacter sp. JMF_04 NA10]MDA3076170.1 histidine kinase [Campylobacter sp. JMF_04 NA10]
MKKVLLFSLAGALSLNAALSDSEILSMYGGLPANLKISVAERMPVEGLKDIQAVILKISNGEISQEEVIFTSGDLVLMDVIDPKKQILYKDQIKQSRLSKGVASVYKSESKDNIITLGNDPKKPTLLMLTDAECPFCRRELAEIERTLKSNNVEIIMTSVHGDSGHAKSALIYKEVKSAKTDAEKIAVLRKYYAEDNKANASSVSPEELKSAKAIADKYFSAGMNSVPFIIETSKLK